MWNSAPAIYKSSLNEVSEGWVQKYIGLGYVKENYEKSKLLDTFFFKSDIPQ